MKNDFAVNRALESWYSRAIDAGCKQAEAVDIIPSDKFIRNMELLLDGMSAPRTAVRKRVIRKRVAALIAAAVLVAALALGSYAGRKAIGSFFVKAFEKKTSFVYKSDGPLPESVDFSLGYMPEGYSLKDESIVADSLRRTYVNTATQKSFTCICTIIDNPVIDMNNENAEYESLKINGCEALLYKDDGVACVSVFAGKLLFFVSGELSQEEILSVASGLVIE